jgi:hypothetical protein
MSPDLPPISNITSGQQAQIMQPGSATKACIHLRFPSLTAGKSLIVDTSLAAAAPGADDAGRTG